MLVYCSNIRDIHRYTLPISTNHIVVGHLVKCIQMSKITIFYRWCIGGINHSQSWVVFFVGFWHHLFAPVRQSAKSTCQAERQSAKRWCAGGMGRQGDAGSGNQKRAKKSEFPFFLDVKIC